MNDNFYPSVTWDLPVSEGSSAHLTHIVRDQSFVTWLAAINETTMEIVVLNTVTWTFYLEIDFDPTKELGERTISITPRYQKQPEITSGICDRKHSVCAQTNPFQIANKNNHNKIACPIPISALVRPSANYAQTLIWRPTNGQSVVIVPSKEQHRDKNPLVLYNNLPSNRHSMLQSPEHTSDIDAFDDEDL